MTHLHLGSSLEGWPKKKPVRLVWTDPPFGTDKVQKQGANSFQDVAASDVPMLVTGALRHIPLASDFTVCICLDDRAASAVEEAVKREFGWHFRGEIIWSFGLGRPRTSWWPRRHNRLMTFTESETSGLFDKSAVPMVERLAPKAGYTGKKPAGSVWDKTMSNTDPERVGYPNQKPVSIIEPFVLAHTLKGDTVADPFMGSGSTGVAALRNGRKFVGCDISPQAVKTARKRLSKKGKK